MGFGGDSGCDETSVYQDLASGWLVGDEGDVEDSEVSLACTVRELEKPFAENPGRDAGLGLDQRAPWCGGTRAGLRASAFNKLTLPGSLGGRGVMARD